MKKIIPLFLVLLSVFFACKKTKPELNPADEQSLWMFDVLCMNKQLFLDNDSSVKGMTLQLEFDYPSKYENDSILRMIQSSFVIAFAGEEYKEKLPKEAFDIFLKKITDESLQIGGLAKDDGTDFSDYYKKINTSVFDTTHVMITAKTSGDDYMGGAHGSSSIFYYNISLKDGLIKRESELFKKKYEKPLTKLIRNKLKNLIEQGKNVTVLDKNLVKPNGNFYFDERGMVYVFNKGEIAPYSDGLVEVSISYFDLKKLINPEYEAWIIPQKPKTE